MFENLSDRLSKTLKNITGKGRLTEDNIKDTLREVRMALLEADVALPVVREFINKVKERAIGEEVNKSLTPGQEFLKIVRAELEQAMGEANEGLNLATQPPAVILMAGKEKSACGFCRRLPPSRDQTASNLGGSVKSRFFPNRNHAKAC